jgi:hypothetical protein
MSTPAPGLGSAATAPNQHPLDRSRLLWLALLWAVASTHCAAATATSEPSTAQTLAHADRQPASIPIEKYPDLEISVTLVVFQKRIFGFHHTAGRDCDAEHHECYRTCKQTKPSWPIPFGGSRHAAYCATFCLAEYMACLSAEASQQTFVSMGAAADWLYRHPQVIGSAIVVVGVGVFVVATDGAGIVLVPWSQQLIAR